jgi:hypothetical protein
MALVTVDNDDQRLNFLEKKKRKKNERKRKRKKWSPFNRQEQIENIWAGYAERHYLIIIHALTIRFKTRRELENSLLFLAADRLMEFLW